MMEEDLKRLRDLHKELWKETSSGRPYYRTSWWPVRRVLNSEERKFLYRCIVEYNLICDLGAKMNQGMKMAVYQTCETIGEETYPGVTYSTKDLKHVITIDEDHIFDDSAPYYRYRNWCEKKGTSIVRFTYKFFTAIVGREWNLELMKRYNLSKPYIQPVESFIY